VKRREFITLVGGTVIVWSLAAHAQQIGVRRVGVLMSTGADSAESQARLAAFLQGLQEFGWAVGRNLRIDPSRERRAHRSREGKGGWSKLEQSMH